MTDQQIEERVARAKELFHLGYNCSQSVFAACADLYGIDDLDLALRLSASFGGGIGRMRMVCGAASGMFLLAGLHNGSARLCVGCYIHICISGFLRTFKLRRGIAVPRFFLDGVIV